MHVACRAVLLALVLVLTACGGGTPTRHETPGTPAAPSTSNGTSTSTSTSNGTSTSTSTSTSSSNGASAASSDPADSAGAAGDLARLAESAQAAASALPAQPTQPPQSAPMDRGIVEGADVSWPQCPKGMGIPQRRTLGSPMPLDSARFVVLGLTNGPGNTSNPCLGDQVEWARKRHLLVSAYSVISWPSADRLTQHGSPRKAGYAQAMANVATLKAAGLETPAIWLDIEPVPDFDWPAGPDPAVLAANAEVVRGAAQAYADQGFQVGVYSTTALWKRVVGSAALGLREWRAAGHTSRAEALNRCGPERMIQGGSAVLAQWVEYGRDRNVTCPGESVSLPLWFHQY